MQVTVNGYGYRSTVAVMGGHFMIPLNAAHRQATGLAAGDAVVVSLKRRGIVILLAGMKSPRNLGMEYAVEFDGLYPEIAAQHKVLFYPFFLDGVAADLKLNQADGIHPNEKGSQVIVRRILPFVEKLIGQIKAKPANAPTP